MGHFEDLDKARALVGEAIALCDAAGVGLAANHLQLGVDHIDRALPAILREERAPFNGKRSLALPIAPERA